MNRIPSALIIGATSSKRSRDSSILLRKAANSRRAGPSAKPEAEAVLAQQVEDLRLLSDPQWVVPGMMTSAVPRSKLGQPAAK